MSWDQMLLFCAAIIMVSSPIAFADILSPKKQLEQGVLPEEIICRHNFSLVLRESGTPACVRPLTADVLERRGWTIHEVVQLDKLHMPPAKTAPLDIRTAPASPGSTVSFYVTDWDLDIAPSSPDIVSTAGLIEITVNGVSIDAPATMTETGSSTGRFLVLVDLPDMVGGKPLQQGDVVLLRYLDQTDYSGNLRSHTESVPLSSTYARIETIGEDSRIGREFTVRLYEPDANTDSRDEDKIALNLIEYRGENGVRTTLANPGFDANSRYLVETGPNTGIFEVEIEIPRKLDGQTVHIGHWYELYYIDKNNPSHTDEKIILERRIG